MNARAKETQNGKPTVEPAIAYETAAGTCFRGHAEDVLKSRLTKQFKGKVDLIFTSPPFPLNRKKKYDNLQGKAYVKWLKSFAAVFKEFLKPTGSIVMEVGNSWEACDEHVGIGVTSRVLEGR